MPVLSRNTPDLDYRRLVRASKNLNPNSTKQKIRVAILSDAAAQQLVPLLRTLFHENGIDAAFYEGAFDSLELEVLDQSSALYTFQPDIVVIASCTQALRARFYQQGSTNFVEASTSRMLQSWDALQLRSTATIIQFTYPAPYERQFGHYDLKAPQSFYSTVAELNANIAACARKRSNLLICDVEGISSYVGRQNWFDDRLWNMTKAFCQLDHLPLVAQALVEIALSTLGKIVKCVILDLDNTLWGGVVGDDGPLGVAIGPHGDGEAFYHFQCFLRSLKERGIVLAVCSKNNHEVAVQPFLENSDMVLKLGDFAVFVANWENKADNIRTIRETLQIGFDSMVFLDDNPFERNLVRQYLPEVIVPEMPEDPADYVHAISALNLFETNSFSAEDLKRSELYQRQAERVALQSNFLNVDDYLSSLEMKIEVARFKKSQVSRIAQLFQRSNQFNLTTHRYNEAQCEAMMLDLAGCVPLSADLSDRFGNHGLISIVVLHLLPEELKISDWLMSCRVLARGVEDVLMTRVVQIAKSFNLPWITGEYLATPKNAMVKRFYEGFGFENVSDSESHSQWRLRPEAYNPRPVFITNAFEDNGTSTSTAEA